MPHTLPSIHDSTSLPNMSNVFWLELAVLVSIALSQFVAFFRTGRHIAVLRSIFPDGRLYRLVTCIFQKNQLSSIDAETVRNTLEKSPAASQVQFFSGQAPAAESAASDTPAPQPAEVKLIGGGHKNPIYRELQRDVNIYLVRNKNHSTDFKIIRDITERYCESEGNLAESALNMPLYLGLLGTMAGVVVGAMHLGLSVDMALTDVGTLLQTVGLAMSVSALGLLLTIINANRCRTAQRQMESRKNQFFTFIQTELLPTLSNDLERSLDKLQENLDTFNLDFKDNLAKFNANVGDVQKNLELQKATLNQIERIGLENMLQTFGRIAYDVTKSADAFGQFKEYQTQLAETLSHFRESIQNLGSLYQNTEHFTTDLALVAENIHRQHATYDRILAVLDENYTEVEARQHVIRTVTDELNVFVRNHFAEFQKNLQHYSDDFEKTRDTHIVTVREAYEQLEAFLKQKSGELRTLSEKEQKEIEEAFRARHQHFDHLGRLPNIERALNAMTTREQQDGMLQLLLSNLLRLSAQMEEQNNLLKKSRVSIGWFARMFHFFRKRSTSNTLENGKT